MHKQRLVITAIIAATSAALVVAQEKETRTGEAEAKIFTASELQWRDGSPGLPAGAQIVVLDGDPRMGGSFTMRLKMPAGYSIPPHTHPTAERVTVISGVVHLGIGEKFNKSAGRELKPGDFATVPAGVPHFAWTKDEAVLQIQSEGPFERKFVDPSTATGEAKK